MNYNYLKIENFNKLKAGEHTALLYENKSEYINASLSFIKSSLNRNEKCLYVVEDNDKEILINALQKNIVGLEGFLKNGNLQLISRKEISSLIDISQNDCLTDFIKRKSLKSLEEGYSGLGISGMLNRAMKYEDCNEKMNHLEWHLSNNIFDKYPITAMCRCNINNCDDSFIKATIELHTYIIWKNKVHENPYFIDSKKYRTNKSLSYEIESRLKNIQEYEKRESRFKQVLEAKKDEYQFLFNQINDAVYLNKIENDDLGMFLKVNNKACQMLDYSREELLKMSPKDIDYPKKDEQFYKNIIKEIREKKEVYLEVNHTSSSGKIIPVELNLSCYKDQENDFLLTIARDISQRKAKEVELIETKNKLQLKNESLEANNEEIIAMNESLDESLLEIHELNARFIKLIELFSNRKKLQYGNEKEYLTDILETAIKVIPEADFGSVYKYEDEKVNFISTKGFDLKKLAELDLPAEPFYNLNDDIEVISYAEIRSLNKKHLTFDNYLKLEKMNNIKEVMRMDLKMSGVRKIGLNLDIAAASSKEFSGNSLSIFKVFQNIASSFYTIREYNNLQSSFIKELINSIIKMLEMHDIYTKGHSENVAYLASKTAEQMGLSQKMIDDTYWTGLVHDIGKLLIPIKILNKPQKLTDEEYELIKEHPVLGSRALKGSDRLKHIAKYVKYHHERWDGRGYPSGLVENEIPLVSQIIQIADAWDAMCSNRAYKKGMNFEEAVREIKVNKGTQFAPEISDYFLEMLENEDIYLKSQV